MSSEFSRNYEELENLEEMFLRDLLNNINIILFKSTANININNSKNNNNYMSLKG